MTPIRIPPYLVAALGGGARAFDEGPSTAPAMTYTVIAPDAPWSPDATQAGAHWLHDLALAGATAVAVRVLLRRR